MTCLVVSLSACSNSGSDTEPPPSIDTVVSLPADTLVFNGQQTGNFEIYRVAKAGGQATALTQDERYDSWWPRVSPDRQQILFYRTPSGAGDDYAQASLWTMDSDGTQPREIIASQANGWTIQGHAEWAPDGQALVMCGTADSAVHIFVTNADGQNPERKTLDGTWNCDPAFSPDGSKIIFNRCESAGPCGDLVTKPDLELYTMPAGGGGISAGAMTRLTNNQLADYDAYYSPHGSSIAWLQLVSPSAWNGVGAWSIQAMDSDGGNSRPVIDDGFINSKPAWSLDGATIYFHRLDGTSNGKWGLFSIRSDGNELQLIEPMLPVNLEFPSN